MGGTEERHSGAGYRGTPSPQACQPAPPPALQHERLHPAALRGALLLPVHRVREHRGGEGGPAALLAEGCLLLRVRAREGRASADLEPPGPLTRFPEAQGPEGQAMAAGPRGGGVPWVRRRPGERRAEPPGPGRREVRPSEVGARRRRAADAGARCPAACCVREARGACDVGPSFGSWYLDSGRFTGCVCGQPLGCPDGRGLQTRNGHLPTRFPLTFHLLTPDSVCPYAALST